MPILQDGALVLYGYVGDNFWDEGFTASEVLAALAEHGRENDLTVRLNSGGGIIDDGLAIYNALAAHKGNVRIEIDAIAASSASVIAMAGDEIVMKAGAIMMIHDPANITFGTVADHEKTIEQLSAYATQMASLYAERSGNDVDAVRNDMKAELWLTADEAVAKGYADEAEKAKAKAVAAFDFRVYANAPQRLKALAKRKDWSFETDNRAAASATASTRQSKEPQMTEKTRAEDSTADIDKVKDEAGKSAVAAYRERRKTIMALDEAKGREALAEHLLDADMPIEGIKAALAVAPKAEAAPARAEADAEEYERRRLNGEGLNGGSDRSTGQKPKASINPAAIYEARRGR